MIFLVHAPEFYNLSLEFVILSSPVAPNTAVPHCCTSLICNIVI